MELKTDKIQRMAKDAVRKAGDFVSEKTVSKESRLWGALCYLIAVIVPIIAILTRKEDGFVRRHAYHSLALTGASIVYVIVLSLLLFVVSLIVPLLAALLSLLYLAPLLALLYMAWNSYKGKRTLLPVLGEMSEKLERGKTPQ